jgi:3,4-dihydroxy 2-butanone 4-phosphate synthase/GTP cyclohydrolase II
VNFLVVNNVLFFVLGHACFAACFFLTVSRSSIQFVAETNLPTRWGTFRVRAYRDLQTGMEPVVFIEGNPKDQEDVPVRVHDQCQTSEVFGTYK